MGCNSCKQKNNIETNKNVEDVTESLSGLNIFYRLIAFFTISISLPFILIILLGQIFIAFFLPSKYNLISKKIGKYFNDLMEKSIIKRRQKDFEKREKQFKEKGEYDDDSNLLNIEVYEENNDIEKQN